MLLFPAAGAARPRDDDDVLDVGRVDEELHLDARALHHVPEDERRVGPAPPHRDEHAGERRRRVREVDGQHGPRPDAVGVVFREERAHDVLLFCGRERLLEICHEALALAEGSSGCIGGGWRYNGDFGVRIGLSVCRE